MADPAVAAFDPIFFLHHAIVDRFLSLWAAINPGVWVSPGVAKDGGSFASPPGALYDQTTELMPFWFTTNTFWTSVNVTDTSQLGYTYPDFNEVDIKDTDATRIAISNRVKELYGIYGSDPEAQKLDWTARIEFKKYELGSSFAVLIFLGRVPENPQNWRVSPNYVGGHAFVNIAAKNCVNCCKQQHLVVEGFVHLSRALQELLGSLESNVVELFLRENLFWKVQKTNGEEAELPSLEVAVMVTPLSYAGAIFPVTGESRRNQITHGQNGGSREA